MAEYDSVEPRTRHDRFQLTPSPPFSLRDGQEVRQDLTLRPPPPHPAVIFGILCPRDARARAVVKLLTGSGAPINHVRPDPVTGVYLFDSVRPGSYRLAVASPGFETFLGSRFHVRHGAAVRRDIRLVRRKHAEGATLAGRVETIAGQPLPNAGVVLVSDGDRMPCRTYVTMSIADGEYVLCGVRPGTYVLLAWKRGFVPQQECLLLRRGEHAQRDIVLRPRD